MLFTIRFISAMSYGGAMTSGFMGHLNISMGLLAIGLLFSCIYFDIKLEK